MPRGANIYDEARIQGRNRANANALNVVSPGIVTDGLVLHLDAGNRVSYPASGTVWNDISGSRNNANLTNGPTFSLAGCGSIQFDGSNDFARIDSFGADSNQAISVFCWVYPLDLTTQQSGTRWTNFIINKRNTTSPNANSWQLYTSNSYPVFLMWDSSSNTILDTNNLLANSTNQLQENKWHYAGASTTGENGGFFRMYLDGLLNYEATLTGDRGIETKPVDIGKSGWDLGFFWNGSIANIKIYNRALSPDEILQNYNATKVRYA